MLMQSLRFEALDEMKPRNLRLAGILCGRILQKSDQNGDEIDDNKTSNAEIQFWFSTHIHSHKLCLRGMRKTWKVAEFH